MRAGSVPIACSRSEAHVRYLELRSPKKELEHIECKIHCRRTARTICLVSGRRFGTMLTASTRCNKSEHFNLGWNSSVPKLFKKELQTPERSVGHFKCFFCEGTFDNKNDLQQHQDVCGYRPEGMEFLFLSSQKPRRSEKRAFLENFNLITTGKAEVLSRHKQDVVCDFIVVESSDDEDCDIHDSVNHRTSENAFLIQSPRKLSSEVRVARQPCKRKSTSAGVRSRAAKLLGIDVSSPLGFRLKQHIRAGSIRDSSSHIASNCDEIERYCREKTNESLESDLTFRRSEDPRFRKLKVPSPFTVTYRSTRPSNYCHVYKYSRRQRAEFCKTYDTGLNARSRACLKQLKPASVVVRKLSLKKLRRLDCRNRNIDSRCERVVCEFCRFDVSQLQSLVEAGESSQTCSLFSRETDENSLDLLEYTKCNNKTDADVNAIIHVDDQSSSGRSSDVDAHTRVSDSGVCVQLPTNSSSESTNASDTRSPGFNSTDGQRLVDMWSTSDRLPSLMFLCAVCNRKILCETNSKSAIHSHYASHGIFNISLLTETLPNGQIDLKLVEVRHTPTSQGDHHQLLPVATDETTYQHTKPEEIVLRRKTAASMLASTTSSPSPCRVSRLPGKRKHVKWADQESVADTSSLLSAHDRPFHVTSTEKNDVHMPLSKFTIEPMRLNNVHLSASESTWVAKPDQNPVQVATKPLMRLGLPKASIVDCHSSESPSVTTCNTNEEWVNGNASGEPQSVCYRESDACRGKSIVLQQPVTQLRHDPIIGAYPNSASRYSMLSQGLFDMHSVTPRGGVSEMYNNNSGHSTLSSCKTVSHQTSVPLSANSGLIKPPRDAFTSEIPLSVEASRQLWMSPNVTASSACNLLANTVTSATSSSYFAETLVKCMQAMIQQSMASLPSSAQRSPTAQSSPQTPADCVICID